MSRLRLAPHFDIAIPNRQWSHLNVVTVSPPAGMPCALLAPHGLAGAISGQIHLTFPARHFAAQVLHPSTCLAIGSTFVAPVRDRRPTARDLIFSSVGKILSDQPAKRRLQSEIGRSVRRSERHRSRANSWVRRGRVMRTASLAAVEVARFCQSAPYWLSAASRSGRPLTVSCSRRLIPSAARFGASALAMRNVIAARLGLSASDMDWGTIARIVRPAKAERAHVLVYPVVSGNDQPLAESAQIPLCS